MRELLSKFIIGGLIASSAVTTGAVALRLKDAGARASVSEEAVETLDIDRSRDVGEKKSASDMSDSDDRMFIGGAQAAVADTSNTSSTNTNVSAPLLPAVSVTTTASPALSAGTETSFNALSLALHNKPGDCYIAHNGTVYNVSGHSQWQGCTHRGASGGIDITPFFPHPISYLAGLPKMGTYSSGGAGGTIGNSVLVSNSIGASAALRPVSLEDDDDEFDDD